MPKFLREEYEVGGMTGVVTGLAWTEVGGDILYIESCLTPGKGRLSLTGNLGDVMKESATIAHEWVMAHHKELGIDPKMFETNDINIHVPEGPFRRTVLRPESRWSRRWSRPTRDARSASASP